MDSINLTKIIIYVFSELHTFVCDTSACISLHSCEHTKTGGIYINVL